MPRPTAVLASIRPRRTSAVVLLLGCLLAVTASARDAALVKDIERGSYGCNTSPLIPAQGALYFGVSNHCRGGLALWRTDGTPAGTRTLETFVPGPRNLDGVQAITSVDGLVYFGLRSSDGLGDVVELWRTDGTAGGAVRLWEAGPDERIYSSFLSQPPVVGAVDGKLVFVVDHGYDDATLWVTDGTVQGTHTLPDVASGRFTVRYLDGDGALFLVVSSGVGSYALWRTDGTDQGTQLVQEIGYALGSGPGDAIEVGPDGAIYFVVGFNGVRTLWRSWGTAATTTPILDMPFGSRWVLAAGVHYLTVARRTGVRVWRFDPVGLDLELLNLLDAAPIGDNDLDFLGAGDGIAYFSHYAFIGERERLWRSDGTPDGTFEIFDGLLRGGFHRTASGFAFVPDVSEEPEFLWHTDGTVAGTAPIREARPHAASFDDFTPIDDAITLFVDGGSGTGGAPLLMRTDGSVSGTFPLARVHEIAWNFGVHDGIGIFVAASTLWRSDGTADGTYGLAELGLSTFGAGPRELAAVDESLMFVVNGTLAPGDELWRSDGTRSGTRRVRAFPDDSDVLRLLTRDDGGVSFARGASELWTSDGTTAGTVPLADTSTSADGARIEEIAAVAGSTFVAVRGTDPTRGALWRTDGSSAGTELVASLAPRSLTSFDGALHFSAPIDERVAAIWRSDGSTAGTLPLATFSALSKHRRPEVGPLFASEDALFFSVARRGRTELWQSDGTAAGTARIAALPSTPGLIPQLGVDHGGFVGGRFVFGYVAYGPGAPSGNLWSSDGTAVGTLPIASVSEDGYPTDFVRVGQHLIFRTWQSQPGAPEDSRKLWSTDGTEAGTEVLLDDAALAGAIEVVGDVAYFCVWIGTDDSAHLWRSDGTRAGTEPAFDRPLACGGAIAATNDRLFFSAFKQRYGTELWSAPLDVN